MNVKVDKIFSEMILEKLNSGKICPNTFESIKYFPCDTMKIFLIFRMKF
ncbi:UTP--glucose-1-phosphate uridylyltransferase [Borreliella burgdorferi CA382]|nr:UTP--glucose-1-phosphate uridylyltransferase [Borreliella burgdorferi CA382]